MELKTQIKKYRTELHLSQEELAEKVYVTRQTVSNWENEKSYPDIHSLLLLSSLFNVSLDQLIKGDIVTMKEIISEQETKKFNHYGVIYTVHFVLLIISAVPLFMWLEQYALIPFGILFAITMYWALKVKKLKRENDIQTYKEIIAFSEGKKSDEIAQWISEGAIYMLKKSFWVPYEDSSNYPTVAKAMEAISKYCEKTGESCTFINDNEVEINGKRYEIYRGYEIGSRGNYGIKCKEK